LFSILGVAGSLAAIYGLHRLALWMERRGYLYYRDRRPRSGAAGSFVALQQAIEPRVQHVLRVERLNHQAGDDRETGQGDPRGPAQVRGGVAGVEAGPDPDVEPGPS
jgi:hypothetical protein